MPLGKSCRKDVVQHPLDERVVRVCLKKFNYLKPTINFSEWPFLVSNKNMRFGRKKINASFLLFLK